VGQSQANEKVICPDCGLRQGITRVELQAGDYKKVT
jgi:hypothetical protein